MSRMLNVLLSVYACGNSGSGVEGIIGLNWVRALSRRCRITVITETGCREQIEQEKNRLFAGRIMPEFYYVDIVEQFFVPFFEEFQIFDLRLSVRTNNAHKRSEFSRTHRVVG